MTVLFIFVFLAYLLSLLSLLFCFSNLTTLSEKIISLIGYSAAALMLGDVAWLVLVKGIDHWSSGAFVEWVLWPAFGGMWIGGVGAVWGDLRGEKGKERDVEIGLEEEVVVEERMFDRVEEEDGKGYGEGGIDEEECSDTGDVAEVAYKNGTQYRKLGYVSED